MEPGGGPQPPPRPPRDTHRPGTPSVAPLQASWSSAESLKVRVPVPTEVPVLLASTREVEVSAVTVNQPGRQSALLVLTEAVSTPT